MHSHNHSHQHHDLKETKQSFLFGILVNGLFTAVELVVGLLSGSLMLLSEALHDFTDTAALLFSYLMAGQAQRAPTSSKTFGFRRATIIAAFLNGSILLILSLFLLYRAYGRLFAPVAVNSTMVIVVAVIGVIANGLIMWKFHKHGHDLNVRSAWWHMMEDMLSWIAILVGSIVMYFTHWYIIDPLLSMIIALYVLYGGYTILRDTVHVLLEGVPTGVSIEEVKKYLKKQKGVKGVHDLHIWSLGSNDRVLSCHIVTNVKALKDSTALVARLRKGLQENYHIMHSTIECEYEHCGGGC